MCELTYITDACVVPAADEWLSSSEFFVNGDPCLVPGVEVEQIWTGGNDCSTQFICVEAPVINESRWPSCRTLSSFHFSLNNPQYLVQVPIRF